MRSILLCFFIIILSSQALAEDLHDEAAALVLSKIARVLVDVKTVSADFTQERHLSIYQQVQISSGKLYFEKPNRMRWEYVSPLTAGFSVNGNIAKKWQGNSEPQVFELEKDPMIKTFVKIVTACVNADFKEMEKDFQIKVVKNIPAVLRLIPLDSALNRELDLIELSFAGANGAIKAVEIRETDGDYTLIRFRNAHFNEKIKEILF